MTQKRPESSKISPVKLVQSQLPMKFGTLNSRSKFLSTRPITLTLACAPQYFAALTLPTEQSSTSGPKLLLQFLILQEPSSQDVPDVASATYQMRPRMGMGDSKCNCKTPSVTALPSVTAGGEQGTRLRREVGTGCLGLCL
jgi:hypothetical protein